MNRRINHSNPLFEREVDLDQEVKRFSTKFDRLSQYQKEKVMEEKFNEVKLKKYKPREIDLSWLQILFGVMALALLVLFYQNKGMLFPQKKVINYCDTHKFNPDRSCVDCPADAECKNGRIVKCFDNKIIYDQ